jgi:predicted DNA-binding ribbon-helix-helix protein
MANLTSPAASGRGGSMPGAQRKSRIVKRSIVIAGHKTSISLEEDFWQALKEIAARRNMRLSELVTPIDAERVHTNLSSAIRLFVLGFYRLELEATRARRPRREPSTASGT